MKITQNDVQQAFRISKVLQDYFDMNQGHGTLNFNDNLVQSSTGSENGLT
jgi:hypothetical protein